MADKDEEKTGADPKEEEKQTEGDEETPEDSSADDDSSKGDESDDDADDDEEEEDDDDSDDDDDDDDDDSEPPVRKKDNAFWVGYRKGKKASKQNKSDDSDDDSDDDDDDSGDGDDDDDDAELHPRDRKILQKELSKALDPITKKLASKEDEDELQGYLSENPHAKPFEKKIRKYMAHPSRQHLPVNTVALEVIGAKRLMRMGAQKGENANKRASKTKGGGSSSRKAGDGGNVFDESPEEFEARKMRVRQKGNQ